MSTVLMVTPYPPVRDGIAAYAAQAVARLRAEGHDVEVLSPGPTAAHHHLDLVGPRGALALAKRARNYDRTIVQFHPDIFYPNPASLRQKLAETAALAVAFRAARHVEVRVHETDYSQGRRPGPLAVALRRMWRSADRIVVHTEAERADFARSFGVPTSKLFVADHGAHFLPRTTDDRATARATLGVPEDETVFLTIGFIQPHKGFDRAVRAFREAGLGSRRSSLHVVGSVRVEEPAYLEHLKQLQALAASTPGVHLHVGYVSDVDFDRWIVAADVVVLPYRFIWSSGVLERAALYERPVIATRVGGLADQAAASGSTVLVEDDKGLRRAMEAVVGGGQEALVALSAPSLPWPDGRDAVQAEVVVRAAARRGGPVAAVGRPGSGLSVVAADDEGSAANGSGAARASAAAAASVVLRRVPPLAMPHGGGGRSAAALVKRAVLRLTAWQLHPVVHQINKLQQAVVDAVETLAVEEQAQGGAGQGGAGQGGAGHR